MIELRENHSFSGEDIDVLFVSDNQRLPAEIHVPVVIRVFWNGASEIIESLENYPDRVHEIILTFFTDVAEQVSKKAKVIQVPFVFSTGSSIKAPVKPRIGYVGEVDITSRCFDSYGKPISSLALESIQSSSLAVTEGKLRFDQIIHECPSEFRELDGLENQWKWSLQNWIRWRMISLLVDEFPQKIVLRGDDWTRLGFTAKKSRFSPTLRKYEYSRNAVSVDFGSKSTTDFLYPRASEIVASRGGLFQLSLSNASTGLQELDNRRFNSGDELLDLLERRLNQDRLDWKESDQLLQSEFNSIRDDATSSLISMCEEFKMKS